MATHSSSVAAVAVTSLAGVAAFVAYQYYEKKQDERKMEECIESLHTLAKQYAREVIDSVSKKVESFSSSTKESSQVVDELLTEMISKLTLKDQEQQQQPTSATADVMDDAPPSFMQQVNYPGSSKSALAFDYPSEVETVTEGDSLNGISSEEDYDSDEHYKESFSGEEDMARVYLTQDIITGDFQDALEEIPALPKSSASDEPQRPQPRKKKNRYGHPQARRRHRGSV